MVGFHYEQHSRSSLGLVSKPPDKLEFGPLSLLRVVVHVIQIFGPFGSLRNAGD